MHHRRDPQDPQPRLADVLEHNIRTLHQLREQAAQARGLPGRLADRITTFFGRMAFVYLHVAWFGAWMVVNTGWFGSAPFDPFPYGLLSMIVSLEGIFLATFVLISQNRMSAEAERRADLALQIGLLTEHELTHALKMLDALHAKLGIVDDTDSDLAQLEMWTRPEDVLAEITRLM